jgi:hypothetical protein
MILRGGVLVTASATQSSPSPLQHTIVGYSAPFAWMKLKLQGFQTVFDCTKSIKMYTKQIFSEKKDWSKTVPAELIPLTTTTQI